MSSVNYQNNILHSLEISVEPTELLTPVVKTKSSILLLRKYKGHAYAIVEESQGKLFTSRLFVVRFDKGETLLLKFNQNVLDITVTEKQVSEKIIWQWWIFPDILVTTLILAKECLELELRGEDWVTV